MSITEGVNLWWCGGVYGIVCSGLCIDDASGGDGCNDDGFGVLS